MFILFLSFLAYTSINNKINLIILHFIDFMFHVGDPSALIIFFSKDLYN